MADEELQVTTNDAVEIVKTENNGNAKPHEWFKIVLAVVAISCMYSV